MTAATSATAASEAGLGNARAYYDRLETARRSSCARSRRTQDGAKPVDFNFDMSFNYLPRAYERPGPLIQVYKLRDCPS